jgi:hypothetical protein
MADITTQVLIEIRDEARKTNTRLERLERRQVEAEVRISTEIVAVAGAIREMKDAFLADRRLVDQVSDHERRIQTLESRGEG